MSTTIPPNNNTGLYNTTGTPIPVNDTILANNISATGNVTVGGYILANGSITTESNFVGDLLGNVSAAGNVVANAVYTNNYFYANGQPFSGGGSSTYGNANVAAFLPTYSGNLAGGNLIISGNIFDTTGDLQINSVGNINLAPTGQVAVAGPVSATGNITGSYFIGNGSQLTGLPATYSNANVVTLLAAFGSNVVSTTGNITAGYVLGNGSQLTGLPATYGNANVAAYLPTYTGNLNPNTISATGNVSAQNLQTTGAFGNITGANYVTASYFVGDGSLLTNVNANTSYANSNVTALLASFGSNTISTTGNIYTGNILTNGYYYANGAPFSGGGGSTYGNANVVTLLASFGSNSIVTTGNITAGNITVANLVNANNFIANVTTIVGNITGGNILTAGIISSTGRATYGAVTYANTDGTSGQVLTTYGNGTTYFSTVSGGGGSPGGSNTQIQYNNAGSFAGNSLMTFDNTTGNIGLGNLVINVNDINTVSPINMSTATGTTANGNTVPWRITIGNGYQGSFSPYYDYTTPYSVSYPRVVMSDYLVAAQGVRNNILTAYMWANTNGNMNNSLTRFNNFRGVTVLGGGSSGGNITGNAFTMTTAATQQVYVGGYGSANANALTQVGNINIVNCGVIGTFTGVSVSPGSTANVTGGFYAQMNASDSGGATGYGNAQAVYGFYDVMSNNVSNSSVTGTNLYVGYYHPGNTSVFLNGAAMGSIARGAGSTSGLPNYFAFRNDDNLALTKLGSLYQYHTYQYANATASGSYVINKNLGQVQQYNLTGNVTFTGASNFVSFVSSPNSTVGFVYQNDTVTLIINQGQTGGYNVTLPAMGGLFKYANGSNTVPSTAANTVTTITVTGYWNLADNQTEYLVNISPAFS